MTTELHNTDGTSIEVGYDVLLTPREVAQIVRVDVKTVTNWAKAGKLFHIRTVGGHRRFPEVCVRAMMRGDKEAARTEPPVSTLTYVADRR